jgi:outer membrane protein
MTFNRRFWVLCLAGALLHCATVGIESSYAADYKLGYIDSERIFREYNRTRTEQSNFQMDLEGWARQVESKHAELEKLEREFETQKLMLSDARRKEKEDELLSKRSEYEQLNREIYGPTGKLAMRNQQISQQLVSEIKRVVETIAAEDGYSIIFDSADGNLVYGDPSLDLTDRVVRELNSGTGNTNTNQDGN